MLVRIRSKSRNLVRTRSVWPRLGPYSARMDPTGSGKPLGCLPDPKTSGKIKNRQIRELGEIPPISPYYPGLGVAILFPPTVVPQGGLSVSPWHTCAVPGAGGQVSGRVDGFAEYLGSLTFNIATTPGWIIGRFPIY